MSGIGSWGSRVGEQVMDGMQKRLMTERERETEGEDAEVLAPGGQEGGPGVEGPQHPFVPFSFTFGFLTPWWDG